LSGLLSISGAYIENMLNAAQINAQHQSIPRIFPEWNFMDK
jgi:hypothetical protein